MRKAGKDGNDGNDRKDGDTKAKPRKKAAEEGGRPAESRRGRAPEGRPRRRSQVWTGTISFGLVTIPVSLQPAERGRAVGFKLLDQKDHSPVGYKKVNKATGEEVPSERIVKGFEIEKGEFVVVSEEELERATPERTQRIDIVAFVEQGSIPVVYFAKPYYLEPAGRSDKAYALLREAMRRSNRIGLATVVIKARQYLAALIPAGDGLLLELLRYQDELRDPSDLRLPPGDLSALKVTDAELKMAQRLIDDMAGEWDPAKFRDEYSAEVLRLISEKAKTGRIEAAPEAAEEERAAPPTDLMALLKKSLSEGQGRGAGQTLH